MGTEKPESSQRFDVTHVAGFAITWWIDGPVSEVEVVDVHPIAGRENEPARSRSEVIDFPESFSVSATRARGARIDEIFPGGMCPSGRGVDAGRLFPRMSRGRGIPPR